MCDDCMMLHDHELADDGEGPATVEVINSSGEPIADVPADDVGALLKDGTIKQGDSGLVATNQAAIKRHSKKAL